MMMQSNYSATVGASCLIEYFVASYRKEQEGEAMTSQHSPGRLAIVTGASRSRGIGAATCLALAEAGVDIFFTHWSPYDHRMTWGAAEHEPDQMQRQVQAQGELRELRTIGLGKSDAT